MRTPSSAARGTELAKIFCLWKPAGEDCVGHLKINWTFKGGAEEDRETGPLTSRLQVGQGFSRWGSQTTHDL